MAQRSQREPTLRMEVIRLVPQVQSRLFLPAKKGQRVKVHVLFLHVVSMVNDRVGIHFFVPSDKFDN